MRARVLLFLPFFLCAVLSNVTGQVVTKVGCTEYQAGWLYSDGVARSFIYNTKSGHVEFTPFQTGGRKIVDISTGFNLITMLDDQGYVWVNNGGQATATRWDKDAYGNTFDGNVSIYGYFFTYLSIRKDGSIWYWGGDDYKFYGGQTLNAPVKLHTPPGVKFTKLSTGNALLALSTTGDVYYWDKTDSNYIKIPLPRPASDIAASHMGYYIAVVPDNINVSKDGWPYAWGPESKYWGSQIPAAPQAPVAIKSLWNMTYPIREINANQNTLHYIDTQGDMYGMGDNANGEVGNGEELVNHAEKYATPYSWNWGKYGLMVMQPVKILPGTKWKHLFTGNSFAFYNYATDVNDSLYFWGRNKSFVGGDGVVNNQEGTWPNALDVVKPTKRTPLAITPTQTTAYNFAPYTLKATTKQKIKDNSATLSATATASTLSLPGKANYGYTIVKYQWAQVSGPSTATLASPDKLTSKVSGLTDGTYIFSIQTTDNNTGTITAYDTIVVNSSGVETPNPTVSAGADQSVTQPASSVTLTGSGAGYSSSGTSSAGSSSASNITSYQWSQVSGPNTAAFGNAKAAQTTVTGLVAGTYVFQLTVTDKTGQTASDQVTVTVNAITGSFLVNAGPDQTITLPTNSIVINAVATITGGQVLSLTKWTQVSGPSTATITNGGSIAPTFGGLVQGIYVFQVSLLNVLGITVSDQVTVTVKAPATPGLSVNAGANLTVTLPSGVTLTGAATATNSSVTSYQWSQVSGPSTAFFSNSKAAQSSITGLVAGTYVFKLTATGSTGLTASAQVTVTVKPAPGATLAVNAGTNLTVTLPSRATLTGTATVTNNSVTSYQWSQVSGPNTAFFSNSKAAQSEITGLVAGTYVFKLTVTGSTGLTASAQVTVTVKPAPGATLAVNAGADQTVTWPSRATLKGTATATNSSVKSYEWAQLSGPATAYFMNSKAAESEITGLVAGTYVFKLTATGSTGLTASDQMTLKVNPGVPPTLSVDAGADQTVILPSRATLTGEGHSTNNAITGYQWSQVSGPSTAYFNNAKAAKSEITGLVAGTYVFKLTATGSAGLTASDVVSVTAKNSTSARAVTTDGEVSALSIDDSTDDASRTVRLYPNPVMIDQQLAVEGQGWKAGTLKFSIYDLGGRMVKQVVLDNQFSYFRQTIPVGGLAKGVYMLTIQAKGQKSKVLRFIVQ
ncbi:MAG TPA: T9SS type A sorting domain-containing protein [Puia sp.]|nr:T9SS type A sorting domain-containing protein [Puia sp.]